MSQDDIGIKSRRTVLRSVGALSTIGLANVSSANEGRNGELTVLKGSYESPLTVDEIEEARESVTDTDVLRAEFDAGNGEIVSAVMKGTEEGIKQYIGIANSPKDVGEAHRGADARRDSFGEGGVGTQSDGWSEYEDGIITTYSEPHGELENIYTLYHDSYDYWTLHDRYVMVPGTVKYDSNWKNTDGNTKQEWSGYDNSMEMEDWEPFGGSSGSTSVSSEVEASSSPGVSYGWSYTTNETHIDDLTVRSDNYAEFDITFNASSETTTSGFEPGSLAKFISRDDYDFNHLLNLSSEGRFGYNGYETVSHQANFYF